LRTPIFDGCYRFHISLGCNGRSGLSLGGKHSGSALCRSAFLALDSQTYNMMSGLI
jgi:hypothetical protein